MAVKHLNLEEFKNEVFNFTESKEWNFKGDKPMIIDFYADWCGPCQALGPILEDLSKKYEGKVEIRKVNTEHEQELSAAFGIRSIPSMLFVPTSGQPQMAAGLMPKPAIEEAIASILDIK